MPGHCLDGESGEGVEAGESDEDPESVQGNDGDSGWYSTELLSAGEALHRTAESPLHPAAGIPGAGSPHAPPHRHRHHYLQVIKIIFIIT